MPRTRLWWGILVFAMAAVVVYGGGYVSQVSAESHQVELEGFNGSILVLPNQMRKEVTIALTMNQAGAGGSNQIVFHIQESTGRVPSSWSGSGRVLVGEGIIAVIPQGRAQGLLFQYPKMSIPTSLAQWKFDRFLMYGIARYGEHTPLSSTQLEELVRTGQIGEISGKVMLDTVKFIPDGNFIRIGDPSCSSGGEGAISCAIGTTCSVVCGEGFYACCNPGSCKCYKYVQ